MKKLYEILFENKKPEEQPLKLQIKLMSTATPDEQLDENEWYKLIYDLNNKRLGQMCVWLVNEKALQKCGAFLNPLL